MGRRHCRFHRFSEHHGNLQQAPIFCRRPECFGVRAHLSVKLAHRNRRPGCRCRSFRSGSRRGLQRIRLRHRAHSSAQHENLRFSKRSRRQRDRSHLSSRSDRDFRTRHRPGDSHSSHSSQRLLSDNARRRAGHHQRRGHASALRLVRPDQRRGADGDRFDTEPPLHSIPPATSTSPAKRHPPISR